ncbi:Hpt domain-containing protein [Arthrobacter globiformis]|uniref:Hpt domain-containing protein n=1 Tax=Arthrobacter globiformis TaxID=1665 RepID=A0A328HFM5_ARTGO|nr:Hpt domain-containing protein [Arthrobacter globiformis]RAM37302.1 Hpt domain-containing protein [Arthrobacter globiformis]
MPETHVHPGLDMSWVRSLTAELGTAEPALRFLAEYLEMLPARIARIQATMDDRDAEACEDAVLSLRVTSSMAGAVDVEAECLAIESSIREGDFHSAQEAAAGMHATVQQLREAGPGLLAHARTALPAPA